jgi:GTP-binding nuclear protein Ran
MMLFDVTSAAAYRNAATSHKDLVRVCPNLAIVLVGNQIDVQNRKAPAKRLTLHTTTNMR